MKLAVAFLLSFLALVTQQQRFPYQSRGLFPTTLRDFQFNDVDLYSYLLARRLMQSAYPALPQLDAYAVKRIIISSLHYVTVVPTYRAIRIYSTLLSLALNSISTSFSILKPRETVSVVIPLTIK